jgi:hypothetical protein
MKKEMQRQAELDRMNVGAFGAMLIYTAWYGYTLYKRHTAPKTELIIVDFSKK